MTALKFFARFVEDAAALVVRVVFIIAAALFLFGMLTNSSPCHVSPRGEEYCPLPDDE
jgi:hypothetical protein